MSRSCSRRRSRRGCVDVVQKPGGTFHPRVGNSVHCVRPNSYMAVFPGPEGVWQVAAVAVAKLQVLEIDALV